MSIRRELFAGEVLYQQGEPSDCAWLVESGQVELVSVHGRRTSRHGVMGPGELIGELGLIDGSPRSATATARSDCMLLAIEREQFLERLQGGDPILRSVNGSNENIASTRRCDVLPKDRVSVVISQFCDSTSSKSKNFRY